MPRSRKRCATNSFEQPEALVFFLDRSVGRHDVAGALRAAGVGVELHDDHSPPTTADGEWLRAVGERGWIVMTKDKRIRRNPLELAAFADARVRAFVLVGNGMTGADMAANVRRHWGRIVHEARSRPPPFVALVYSARVTMLSRGGSRRRRP